MPRASRGAGVSYLERKDGLWAAQISLGYANGRRVRQFVYGKTKAEAADKARAVLNRAERNESTTTAKDTLESFLGDYLAHNKAQRTAGTYAQKEIVSRKHVVPYIGKLKFAAVTPADVQNLYKTLRTRRPKPVGRRTILAVHELLHAAFEHALDLEVPGVYRNPLARLERPFYEAKEREPYSADEARKLIAAIVDDDLEAFYLLELFSGMREGELFALQLADLDLRNGALTLRRSVDASVSSGIKRTKNKSSRRQIPLPLVVVESLKKHRKKIAALGIETTFVFPNAVGESRDRHNFIKRDFYPLLERAGLRKIHFHDLRHSFASLMLALGVHPKVVQELGGWSDIKTLMATYSHVIPSMGRDAVEGLVIELFRPAAADLDKAAEA